MDERGARTLVAPGELRPDLMRLIEAPAGGVDCLLAAPGLLPPNAVAAALAENPTRVMPRSRAFAHRRATLDFFARLVDRLPKTLDWEVALRRWLPALAVANVRVRHFAEHPVHSRLLSLPERTVVPQAPLVWDGPQAGVELALELAGAQHHAARQWFSNLFDRADDISADVMASIDASWAGAWCSAEDAYYKVLADYFGELVHGLDQEGDDNPMLDYLTEFQLEAYTLARTILARFGGVFLADVVGLGKTFIALALLSHLQRRYGEHAVVVAPPAVCSAWQHLAAEFRIELQTVSLGKLEDLDELTDREILVVDESHNFRNTGTQRYEAIQKWLRPDGAASNRKVMLLSATPQNSSPQDGKHQLALFPDNYARLPFAGESLDGWFRDVALGRAALPDLLQHVIVRRTRSRIREAHPNAVLRVKVGPGRYETRPLVFPTRVSGDAECLRYDIEEVYRADFYSELLLAVQTMRYPLYGLGDYLLPQFADDARVTGLRRTGTSLRGLFKVLLLKRLESSAHALAVTLRNLLVRLDAAVDDLARRRVRVGRRRDASALAVMPEDDESDRAEVGNASDLDAGMFDVARLQDDLQLDRTTVVRVLGNTEALLARGDAKLARLLEYLRNRSPVQHRTIVFTQFAATAEYLFGKMEGVGKCEMVTGGSHRPMEIAKRFAPKANRTVVDPERQIDLLISTDALSEGVNLQDADTLINYDIHWNPLRLIQRAGRIDRIGSEHAEIHVASFLPERALEHNLGLEEVLRRRIKEFVETFGEDSHILPSSDKLELGSVLSAYSGRALDEDDAGSDVFDGLSRHADRLLALRREDPERFSRVRGMRPGRRALGGPLPTVIATRQGGHWGFWSVDDAADLRAIANQQGLDRMYHHTRAAVPSTCDPAPGFGLDLMEAAAAAFAPTAARVMAQQLEPQLSGEERFVLDQLEHAKRGTTPNRVALMEELIAWVRSGRAQAQLRRAARVWKREKLSAPAIADETRVLFARFPPRPVDVGELEVVAAVLRGDVEAQEPDTQR
jgi:hypothetical protein